MCLAEALLRTPDDGTRDALIAEKIGAADWASHLGKSDSVFVNASTFGLMLTGKVVDVDAEARADMGGYFRRLTARLGEPVIRAAVGRAIRIMGEQFVLGRSIEEALKRARREGYVCSFDMLGEGARTAADAERYEQSYAQAIAAVGRWQKRRGLRPGARGRARRLRQAVGAVAAVRRPAVGAGVERALPAAEAAGGGRRPVRPQLHPGRGGGRPADPVAEAAGPAVPRAGAGRLARAGAGGAGLSEARPAGDRPRGPPGAAHRPTVDGAPGQGRLLGHGDQEGPGGRPARLPGVDQQGPPPTSTTWSARGPSSTRRPTCTASSPPTTPSRSPR